MILPMKHVSINNSLIGAGAVVLRHLSSSQTPTALWERVRHSLEVKVYGRYILALDFLFAVGAIDFQNGLIVRAKQ